MIGCEPAGEMFGVEFWKDLTPERAKAELAKAQDANQLRKLAYRMGVEAKFNREDGTSCISVFGRLYAEAQALIAGEADRRRLVDKERDSVLYSLSYGAMRATRPHDALLRVFAAIRGHESRGNDLFCPLAIRGSKAYPRLLCAAFMLGQHDGNTPCGHYTMPETKTAAAYGIVFDDEIRGATVGGFLRRAVQLTGWIMLVERGTAGMRGKPSTYMNAPGMVWRQVGENLSDTMPLAAQWDARCKVIHEAMRGW